MKDAGITSYQFRNDSAFQQGFEAGGRLLVEGSIVLGRHGSPVSASSPFPVIEDADIAFEQELLIECWASSQGCWYSNPKSFYDSLGYRLYGYGGEAQVYTEDDRFVHKICRTGQYSTLQSFFERIVIQNSICPVACLEVEGYGRDSLGDFVVLLKQRFFRQAYIMSEAEISDFMKRLGFSVVIEEPYHKVKYYSDSVVVEDLHSGNIWKTLEGNIVVVDGFFSFYHQ